jgi:hypothetical protein
MPLNRYAHRVSNPPFPPPSPTPAQWPTSPVAPKRPSRSLAIASIAIALVALGVAIGSWFRPIPDGKPSPAPSASTFTDQQIAAAKTKVCAIYQKVHQAVLVNTGRSGGTDQTAVLGLAANARIALYNGGDYLLRTLADEPATPSDLVAAVRKLANSYQELAIGYMAEASQSETDSSLHAGDEPNSTLSGICK